MDVRSRHEDSVTVTRRWANRRAIGGHIGLLGSIVLAVGTGIGAGLLKRIDRVRVAVFGFVGGIGNCVVKRRFTVEFNIHISDLRHICEGRIRAGKPRGGWLGADRAVRTTRVACGALRTADVIAASHDGWRPDAERDEDGQRRKRASKTGRKDRRAENTIMRSRPEGHGTHEDC